MIGSHGRRCIRAADWDGTIDSFMRLYRPVTGEARLAWETVRHAMLDAHGRIFSESSASGFQAARKSANEWFLDPTDHYEGGFSFRWCCRVLGINPDVAQDEIRRHGIPCIHKELE
jgi:hypothetical protein